MFLGLVLAAGYWKFGGGGAKNSAPIDSVSTSILSLSDSVRATDDPPPIAERPQLSPSSEPVEEKIESQVLPPTSNIAERLATGIGSSRFLTPPTSNIAERPQLSPSFKPVEEKIESQVLLPTSNKNWRKKYDYVASFFEGRACVKKNGKWGYVDLDGREIIPLTYDEARPFFKGRARVKKKREMGFRRFGRP
jgi:hypothetical protein